MEIYIWDESQQNSPKLLKLWFLKEMFVIPGMLPEVKLKMYFLRTSKKLHL